MKRACWPLLAAALAACSASVVEFEPCDIRTTGCQDTLFLAVQGARNAGWDPWLDKPPMRVISVAQYRAELEQERLAQAALPEEFDYYTPAFKAFALYDPNEAPDGSTQFSVDNIAAYYNQVRRDITIIDRGRSDWQADTHTLAHELVHAAQERDVSFSALRGWVNSVDSANVRGAVVEGEAELYAIIVTLTREDPERIDRVNFPATLANWVSSARKEVVESTSPLRAANLSLRYPLGTEYMSRAWLSGGTLGVRRAFADHPPSALNFMLGGGSPAAVSGEATPCHPPAAAPGFQGVARSELGAWALFAFGTRLGPQVDAWSLAQGWAEDHFLIYADAAKNVAAVWQLRFRSPAQLLAFEQAAQGHLPNGVVMMRTSRPDRLALFGKQAAAAVGTWSWAECGL